MRWIVRLLFLAVILYGILPYYSLYRFDHALVANDVSQLGKYIDLQQVQENYKRVLRIESRDHNEGLASRMLRDGANSMSAYTVDQAVTIEWIRHRLSGANRGETGVSIYDTLDHAFFDSPNQFLVRLGDLGDDPTVLIMKRHGMVWRLSELY
ncbi:MAG: DUF2939 domain-containing protein [Gammaproteobacteria bacterium]|uniref:DUF2939 domain-containing protein n=1 Tax=Candidatus Thiopontia autotrophica TaxID=2841688 RepID=A0A8J6P451_9GAMM|nr:DUF2939 domain-containing protein [Candidatus Thiopontia autotrophica]MBL6969689.1 DUF2939 domain-containing protein [Gammaproteobacteria bacterium]